jgi:hypothetical protein
VTPVNQDAPSEAKNTAAIGGDRFEAEHHHGATLSPAQALALAL